MMSLLCIDTPSMILEKMFEKDMRFKIYKIKKSYPRIIIVDGIINFYLQQNEKFKPLIIVKISMINKEYNSIIAYSLGKVFEFKNKDKKIYVTDNVAKLFSREMSFNHPDYNHFKDCTEMLFNAAESLHQSECIKLQKLKIQTTE